MKSILFACCRLSWLGLVVAKGAFASESIASEYIASEPIIQEHIMPPSGDTLYVSDSATTYIVFDEPISLVDIGLSTQYFVKIEKNSVFVKAKSKLAPLTPIYIVAGQAHFVAKLFFERQPPQVLYDYRKQVLEAKAMLNRNNFIPSTSTKEMARRLMEMKHDAVEQIKTVAVRDDHMTFQLVSVKNDLSASYLKFKVVNHSSIIYKLDFVGFENVEFYRKALFSKKKTNKTAIDPLMSVDVRDIPPYTTTFFYYAIPIYAVGEKGKLLITLREKNGVRTIPLNVSSRVFAKADLY